MEEYSGTHSERVEELMNWPALRFERFYEAYQKRLIVDELKQRKLMMMNALYSNTNYDGDNSKVRDDVIERIESQFEGTVYKLYNGYDPNEVEIDKDDPFFGAMERGLNRQGVPNLEEMENVTLEKSGIESFLPDDVEIDQE